MCNKDQVARNVCRECSYANCRRYLCPLFWLLATRPGKLIAWPQSDELVFAISKSVLLFSLFFIAQDVVSLTSWPSFVTRQPFGKRRQRRRSTSTRFQLEVREYRRWFFAKATNSSSASCFRFVHFAAQVACQKVSFSDDRTTSALPKRDHKNERNQTVSSTEDRAIISLDFGRPEKTEHTIDPEIAKICFRAEIYLLRCFRFCLLFLPSLLSARAEATDCFDAISFYSNVCRLILFFSDFYVIAASMCKRARALENCNRRCFKRNKWWRVLFLFYVFRNHLRSCNCRVHWARVSSHERDDVDCRRQLSIFDFSNFDLGRHNFASLRSSDAKIDLLRLHFSVRLLPELNPKVKSSERIEKEQKKWKWKEKDFF